jgi:RNA polymerase sigma-70 factor (ECF subfamily)
MILGVANCGGAAACVMGVRATRIGAGGIGGVVVPLGAMLRGAVLLGTGSSEAGGETRRMDETDGQDRLSVQLLERVAAGDRDAFRQLYDLHAPRLNAFALRITRHGPLAADAVHDAFLQVWRNAGRFDASRGQPAAWLLSLVRYRALDIARRRGREVPDDDLPERADEDPDPLARLMTSRDAAALHACLRRLPPERQKLMLLAFVEGLTHADLSDRLAVPLGTIKSWIRRGLLALRACLEEAR